MTISITFSKTFVVYIWLKRATPPPTKDSKRLGKRGEGGLRRTLGGARPESKSGVLSELAEAVIGSGTRNGVVPQLVQ